ncbi:MAG: virulence protein SciE type [Acidobacteria bacterium]|nr:virulence protein SciE type [Acidobacteriota bacterium]MCG3195288.1 hypothetical protein [Thermoanaerobaculia bacterium]MCK6685175.1 virulence protein SciE type [Thermoanaerobaculia bacterium]
MSQIKELLDQGRLSEAVAAAVDDVRANPSDIPLRLTLFEVLCLNGEWDRAGKQLEVVGHQSTESAMGVQLYRANMAAEKKREDVFKGKARPTVPGGTVPAHVEFQLAALREIAAGQFAEARRLLDAAEEERPAISGSVAGRRFEDFRDYDDRYGGVLEVIRGSDYYWVPFGLIKSLSVEAPKKLRDLVWAPARLEDREGNKTELFLPVRYPASESHADSAIRLGRMTSWSEAGPDISVGHGMHMFLTDEADMGLLELGRIEFDEGANAPS